MTKCKCETPKPRYEECKFMAAKSGERATEVYTTAFKAICGNCDKLIGWYRDMPAEPTHWTCCGVTRPIDQRCSCGEVGDG